MDEAKEVPEEPSVSSPPSTPWFERWFGDDYKKLYPHRNVAQAAVQVAALVNAVRFSAPDESLNTVLDIGCGAGRHLAALRATEGLRPLGIDLSSVLLRDARSDGHSVARADMRRLPFPDDRFDLVACFFTSFGYFATPAEDAAALREFVRVIRPGGFLFLDLPNRPVVLRDLVPQESGLCEERPLDITRTLEGDQIVKRIRIQGEAGVTDHHEERVRLYDRVSLAPLMTEAGLETTLVFGDEHGAAFDEASSPRLSLLLRRHGRAA